VNRWRWIVPVLALVPGVAAAPAAAPAVPALDIRLERDPRPGALSSALAVNLKVTVTERDTGAVPADDFEVYAFAEPAAGPATEIFPCAQEHDNSPEVPRGIYLCTVLVNHGGRWRFHSVVNQLRADPAGQPVAVGRTAQDFDIHTAEVAPRIDANRIEGRLMEVALLWGHAAAAGVWLVAAASLALLALPALRRRLSTFGLHRLEDRFDVLTKALWTATAVLLASGTYLLANQTAYDTPFSSAGLDAVFRLPYGKPYFLALGVKLAVYAVMLAASFVLLREARRQLRAGAVVVVPASVRLGATAMVGGTVVLSLSITLLKYFHELIEATRAVL
jgi:hypothetical protein